MDGWKFSNHRRTIRKWVSAQPGELYGGLKEFRYDVVEARKGFGGAAVLIQAREDGTFVSMNGTATMNTFDVLDLHRAMSYAEDSLHKGVRF